MQQGEALRVEVGVVVDVGAEAELADPRLFVRNESVRLDRQHHVRHVLAQVVRAGVPRHLVDPKTVGERFERAVVAHAAKVRATA